MAVLNLGSLNIDRVFRVPNVVRAGETIASNALAVFAGGKGANQSVALARAGAQVAHLGKVGPDGQWLVNMLAAERIDTQPIAVGNEPTGQAIIQVADDGGNAIVLVAGANQQITDEEIDAALKGFGPGDWLLVQNETSGVAEAIRRAHERGLRVAFNPAPYDDRVAGYPLELVDLLCVNEIEAEAMTGQTDVEQMAAALALRLPRCEIVLTLGAAGVIRRLADSQIRIAAHKVEAIDTTAAGDTFLGYYLAGVCRGLEAAESLEIATRAAALTVTRQGAIDSIPRLSELSRLA